MKVNVISSNLDGAELRREQNKNPMYTKVSGSHDESVIKEACVRSTKGQTWVLPTDAWDRIFRKES